MHLEDKIMQWQQAKEEAEAAKERLEKITSEIANEMLINEIKSDFVVINDSEYKVTVVQSETLKFDEQALYDALGKRGFSKIADLKLNKKKLEVAVRDGHVDPELVSRSTVIAKSSPYIRVSEHTDPDS